MNRNQGCLAGLGELFLVGWIFRWLQRVIGYRSGSCLGCGCGILLFFIMVWIILSIIFGTNWLRLVMLPFGSMA
jgi:hypothetical protein